MVASIGGNQASQSRHWWYFFRKGAVPASASIDAYSRFYYFIKEFYKVLQIMDHKGSPHESARQK
jgi:hypothetical protein